MNLNRELNNVRTVADHHGEFMKTLILRIQLSTDRQQPTHYIRGVVASIVVVYGHDAT